MIARLLLAIMFALTAIPAPSAACHMPGDGAMVAMHHVPDHPAKAPAKAPEKAMPTHACIGCIPPGDWLGARIAVPPIMRAPADAPTIARLDLGRSAPPALPPPRI